jgi:hypothetical protein
LRTAFAAPVAQRGIEEGGEFAEVVTDVVHGGKGMEGDMGVYVLGVILVRGYLLGMGLRREDLARIGTSHWWYRPGWLEC